MYSAIEKLLCTPCYLIDVFPETVPQKNDNRYFHVEETFLNDRKEFDQRFCRLLLKLYCYYDFHFWSGASFDREPAPEQMIQEIQECFGGNVPECCIYLPESDAMIYMDRDSLHLSVYHPDESLQEMLIRLVPSEGLFFYPAP